MEQGELVGQKALLPGHTKLESTARYLGIEVHDALEISEQTANSTFSRIGNLAQSEVWCYRAVVMMFICHRTPRAYGQPSWTIARFRSTLS
jgi:hypothetical protein